MRRLMTGLGLLALGVAARAGVPGTTLDGLNIPSDFGATNLKATQTNRTGFGNQTSTVGGLTPGSEADALYVRNDDTNLYIAITGNLQTNGNAFLVFLDTDNNAATGQQELKTQGVNGPPFTLQNLGQPTTDCMTFGTGTLLPLGPEFAVAIDTFGGTMFISEYDLVVDPGTTYTCDPGGVQAPLYASRVYIGSSAVNDGNNVLEGTGFPDPFPGYAGGFNNTNVMGVTNSSGAGAASATTGLELSIPLARFGLTAAGQTVRVYVLLASGGGTGANGTVHSQALPALGGGGCAATPAGLQPNLSAEATVTHVLATGSPAPVDPLDGADVQTTFGAAALKATQACPTSAGDQVPDPTQIIYTGGSELDEMYVTSDCQYLYVGLSGTLEPNGNKLILFVDSKAGGERTLLGQDMLGGGVDGMEGDLLPLNPDGSVVDYDYAYELNAGGSGTGGPLYVDVFDLQANSKSYAGQATEGIGNGNLQGGTNPNNLQVAWNRGNVDGVTGCGDFEPCFFDSPSTVAAAAATATRGLELAIPLADLGVTASGGTVRLFAHITSGDGGFNSDQGLPSMRNQQTAMQQNAGSGITDFTFMNPVDPNHSYDARAASATIPASTQVTIASANPPLSSPFTAGPFRDVLQHVTVIGAPRGIGAAGTPDLLGVTYAIPTVTFSSTPGCPLVPAVTCTDVAANGNEDCPTATIGTGSGAGPYQIVLSGRIPNRECTTISFGAGVTGGVQYRMLAGDVAVGTGNGVVTAQDVAQLIAALSGGTANTGSNPLRMNIDRAGPAGAPVTPADVSRLIGILNSGANGATQASCPPL